MRRTQDQVQPQQANPEPRHGMEGFHRRNPPFNIGGRDRAEREVLGKG